MSDDGDLGRFVLDLPDPDAALALAGEAETTLHRLEALTGASMVLRGLQLVITGRPTQIERAAAVVELVRPIWQDARIHYVVNCAAISCPNLARDAYRASEIEQQLAAAARAYVNDPRGAVLDDGELTLSKIYSWYADDFGGESGVLNHLAEYSSSNTELKLMMAEGVDGYVYDWALNDLK